MKLKEIKFKKLRGEEGECSFCGHWDYHYIYAEWTTSDGKSNEGYICDVCIVQILEEIKGFGQ